MIPSSSSIFSEKVTLKIGPSKNYMMYLDRNIIRNHNDKLKAMEQVIYKILNTSRYKFIIYSWNYGIELEDLFGMPVNYVCVECKRRIKEALLQDDRINDVTDFEFDLSKRGIVAVEFLVNTIFGGVASKLKVGY